MAYFITLTVHGYPVLHFVKYSFYFNVMLSRHECLFVDAHLRCSTAQAAIKFHVMNCVVGAKNTNMKLQP
jgi:hypothetical protein